MSMRINIEFDTFEAAVKGAFGLDNGKIVIIQPQKGKWVLTNYGGVKRPGMFLVIDPGTDLESDSAWESLKSDL
jgi:hypothetical protein